MLIMSFEWLIHQMLFIYFIDIDSAQKFEKGTKIQKVENITVSKCAPGSVLFSAKSRKQY